MSEETEDSIALRGVIHAPRRVIKEESNHASTFQELDGRTGISFYENRFNIRPSLSFQVYVTHETSDRHEDMAALAESLYEEILNMDEKIPARLDIHFMGAMPISEAPKACIVHYRAAKEVHADDPALRFVPSHAMGDGDWHGFLITVPRADWRENGGLSLVYFDGPDDPEEFFGDGEEHPDPFHVYPTRKARSGESIEKLDWSVDVPEDDNLWTNEVSDVYIRIRVREEWEQLYWGPWREALEKWAREELARQKAEGEAPADPRCR